MRRAVAVIAVFAVLAGALLAAGVGWAGRAATTGDVLQIRFVATAYARKTETRNIGRAAPEKSVFTEHASLDLVWRIPIVNGELRTESTTLQVLRAEGELKRQSNFADQSCFARLRLKPRDELSFSFAAGPTADHYTFYQPLSQYTYLVSSERSPGSPCRAPHFERILGGAGAVVRANWSPKNYGPVESEDEHSSSARFTLDLAHANKEFTFWYIHRGSVTDATTLAEWWGHVFVQRNGTGPPGTPANPRPPGLVPPSGGGPPPTSCSRPTGPTITSVTFSGSPSKPSVVVHGCLFGKRPPPAPSGHPAGQNGCPANATDDGYDYGTNLYLEDQTKGWAAGRYRPSLGETDCLDLVVTAFSARQVSFRLGSFYAQSYPKFALAPGDAVQIVVNGASIAVHVKYGATVSS